MFQFFDWIDNSWENMLIIMEYFIHNNENNSSIFFACFDLFIEIFWWQRQGIFNLNFSIVEHFIINLFCFMTACIFLAFSLSLNMHIYLQIHSPYYYRDPTYSIDHLLEKGIRVNLSLVWNTFSWKILFL